tara:strand:- start:765 stop:1037 length:273 start_codon:yes stop_codon:yes gene_type:complete
MARKRGAKDAVAPEPEPEPEPVSEAPTPKAKRASVKMTDKQKADLKKHMDNHKDLKDLNTSQLKSHRMKMMSRMRQGKSLAQAHKEIMSS